MANNRAVIGNSSISQIGGYTTWSNLSDARFKTNIEENVAGLDFILKLRPVTYNLDVEKIAEFTGENDKEGVKENADLAKARAAKSAETQTGFLAQEVEATANEIGYDFSGVNAPESDQDHYSISYAEFVVPLVKGMQEQQQLIKAQQEQIELLKAQMLELQKSINPVTK